MLEVPCFTYTLTPKSQLCIDPCVNTGLGVLCLIFTVLGDMSHLQLTEEKTGKQFLPKITSKTQTGQAGRRAVVLH